MITFPMINVNSNAYAKYLVYDTFILWENVVKESNF